MFLISFNSIFVSVPAVVLCISLFPLYIRALPPADRQWKALPELTDEFEGNELDPEKWWPDNPEWNGRDPGWFSVHNVSVSDGKLHLACTKGQPEDCPSPEFTYGSAAVKGKFLVKYGYFEIESRSMESSASSASSRKRRSSSFRI